MKIVITIVSVLAILLGGLWMLQGSNIIAGSGMSGQTQWLVIGAIVALAGLFGLYRTYGRRV